MTWPISVPELGAAEEITRLHRRAAQTGFAHIFPAEAPPPPFEEDLARWQFWLGPDRERGRHACTVQVNGGVVGVVLAGRGYSAGTLWVLEDNVRARRWYERLGWSQTIRRKPAFEPAGIYHAQYVRELHADQ